MKAIKQLLRLTASILFTLVAALVGNWVGDQVRARFTGQSGHQFKFTHSDSTGETYIGLNPVLTNFIPALLLGMVARPSWLWAFIGGAVISGVIGERYERLIAEIR